MTEGKSEEGRLRIIFDRGDTWARDLWTRIGRPNSREDLDKEDDRYERPPNTKTWGMGKLRRWNIWKFKQRDLKDEE